MRKATVQLQVVSRCPYVCLFFLQIFIYCEICTLYWMDVNQTIDSNFEFTKTIQNANISYLYVHTLQENSKFTTWHNVHFLKKERKSKKKKPLQILTNTFFPNRSNENSFYFSVHSLSILRHDFQCMYGEYTGSRERVSRVIKWRWSC